MSSYMIGGVIVKYLKLMVWFLLIGFMVLNIFLLKDNYELKRMEGAHIRGNLSLLEWYLSNAESHIENMLAENKLDEPALEIYKYRFRFLKSDFHLGSFNDFNHYYFEIASSHIDRVLTEELDFESQRQELNEALKLISFLRQDIQLVLEFVGDSDYKLYQQLHRHVYGTELQGRLLKEVNRRGIF